MRVYVSLDLTICTLPDYIDCKALWVDFPGEREPKVCYQVTLEVYVRIEAKVAALGAKVASGAADRKNYTVANSRFLALQEAIRGQIDPEAVSRVREAWRGQIAAGSYPPLPEYPPLVNFPNWTECDPMKFKKWVDSFLCSKVGADTIQT